MIYCKALSAGRVWGAPKKRVGVEALRPKDTTWKRKGAITANIHWRLAGVERRVVFACIQLVRVTAGSGRLGTDQSDGEGSH